jgi:isoamylase
LLEAIANDPVLGGGGGNFGGGGAGNGGGVRLYLTPGEFEVGDMQSWGVWGERVTPAYARDVCAFLEGRNGTAGGFATRVCGSADLIKGDRGSARGHVMNSFVSPPFGKTLADFAGAAAMRAKISPEAAAVHDRSKDAFRGGAIGTKNAGGVGYGVGTREPGASFTSGRAPEKKLPPLPPTPGETALMLRLMLATLFLSDGTPVVAAGDEYGHSLRGHDDAPWAFKHDANAFRWDAIGAGERGGEITRFMAACAAFRRRRADLFAAGGANVSWRDLGGQRAPAWESADAPPQLMCRRHAAAAPGAKAVAASAIGGETRETVVTQDAVAVWNCGSGVARAAIGQPPIGYAWVRVMDTALAAPADCELAYINLAGPQGTYLVAPHAVVLLELAPAPEGLPPTAEQVEAARAAAERRARRIPDAARAAPAEPAPPRAPEQPRGSPPAQRPAPESFPERPASEPEQPARPSMPARPNMPSQPTFRPPP